MGAAPAAAEAADPQQRQRVGGGGWVGGWGKGKMQQQAGHYNPIQSLLTRHFLSSEKGCAAIDFDTK